MLAILVPFANWKGASVGMIVSHIVILSVTFGHLTQDKSVQFLETSIAGCTNESFSSEIQKPTSSLFTLNHQTPIEIFTWIGNETTSTFNPPKATSDNGMFTQNLFAISYMYYSLFGTLITVSVGMIVSLLTLSKSDAYDSKFIHPWIYKLTKLLPASSALFTNDEKISIDVKILSYGSNSKQSMERENPAFDIRSEEIYNASCKCEPNILNFKSNIVFKSDKSIIPPIENYKKINEGNLN